MDSFHVPAAGAAIFCSAMLLLTLLSGTTTSAQKTTTPSLASMSCEPVACGGLRISYPFWLGGTHPPECGYRAFQVTCDGTGMAFLKNSFWKYQILDISYEESSFRVTNINLSNGTCTVDIRVNASSDLGLAPFTISGANQELFFLYNCTDLSSRPPPPTWAPVNCTNGLLNDSFAWLAGVYRSDDQWGAVPGGCNVSMMPVMGYPGAAGKDYWQLMKGGFLLNYTAGNCAAVAKPGYNCVVT